MGSPVAHCLFVGGWAEDLINEPARCRCPRQAASTEPVTQPLRAASCPSIGQFTVTSLMHQRISMRISDAAARGGFVSSAAGAKLIGTDAAAAPQSARDVSRSQPPINGQLLRGHSPQGVPGLQIGGVMGRCAETAPVEQVQKFGLSPCCRAGTP